MYSTNLTGAMIVRNVRRQTLLQAIRPPRSSSGILGCCFTSGSTSPPPEGGSEGAGEKAKQTMDNLLGVTKDTSEKVKERVIGTGSNTERPSKNPDLNHGVESTDSSCEDVRGRPGGYS